MRLPVVYKGDINDHQLLIRLFSIRTLFIITCDILFGYTV